MVDEISSSIQFITFRKSRSIRVWREYQRDMNISKQQHKPKESNPQLKTKKTHRSSISNSSLGNACCFIIEYYHSYVNRRNLQNATNLGTIVQNNKMITTQPIPSSSPKNKKRKHQRFLHTHHLLQYLFIFTIRLASSIFEKNLSFVNMLIQSMLTIPMISQAKFAT